MADFDFTDSTIENQTINVSGGLLVDKNGQPYKESIDNPNWEALKESFPDIKVYGKQKFHQIYRIVTESGGWMEIGEGMEIDGIGVLFRQFNLYLPDKRQSVGLQMIYGASLEDTDCGYKKIVT